jgi:hypothetical protein
MKTLNGYSVLIVEADLDAALALQDSLAMGGARVLTAYGVDRAMLHAQSTNLSAAVVGKSLSAADRNSIFRELLERRIPIMVNREEYGRQLGGRIVANGSTKGVVTQLVEVISSEPA